MSRMELCVVALGGNSIVPHNRSGTIEEQRSLTQATMAQVAAQMAHGGRVVLTHGNGPIIGNIALRNEAMAQSIAPMPLDVCGADSQGGIGYMIQQAMDNEFRRRKLQKTSVTVVTQVEVDPKSPAFQKPSKPIGSFMDEATAKARAAKEGWSIVEDSGRGFRRVVPSPEPLEILELEAIKTLIDAGFVVCAVGGGGIPVIRLPDGDYRGTEAVIDKDFASSLLAGKLAADLFAGAACGGRIPHSSRRLGLVWKTGDS